MHLSLLFRLRRFLAGQRLRLGLFIASLLASALLSVTVPLAFQRVVDDGLAVRATAVAMTWTGVALALGLIAAGAGAVANAMGAEVGTGLPPTFAQSCDTPYRLALARSPWLGPAEEQARGT